MELSFANLVESYSFCGGIVQAIIRNKIKALSDDQHEREITIHLIHEIHRLNNLKFTSFIWIITYVKSVKKLISSSYASQQAHEVVRTSHQTSFSARWDVKLCH